MFNHAIAYVMSVLAADKKDEKGASMVEYAVLVAAIAGIVGLVATAFGDKITAFVSAITL